MKKPPIIITESDHAELSWMLNVDSRFPRECDAISGLQAELKHVNIVAEVPHDVIVMNSRAEMLDLHTNELMEFTVVFPSDANIDEGKISVLAPLGTGMLGHRVGDVFEWPAPFGIRRLKVTQVHRRPEPALPAAAA
jgi:regulator of nucleoside diphosphate kinase